MKLSSACIATAVAIGLMTAAGVSAFGQTGQISQSFDANQQIFNGPESVELRPGAAETLKNIVGQAQQTSGHCPVDVDLLVLASQSDQLFSEALAYARVDAIKAVLQSLGPSVTVNGKGQAALANMVSISAKTGNRDNESPKLSVDWTPDKGKKVKPGQRITAKAVARDDANRFQTGISEIEFLKFPEMTPFGFHQWPQRPMRCEDAPPAHRAEAVYVVPDNPPLIVRLGVNAKDFANHSTMDLATFPTGDWEGVLDWELETNVTPTRTSSGVKSKRSGHTNLVLKQKPDGTVTGSLLGDQIVDHWWGYAGNEQYCHWKTNRPNEVRATLDGAYEQSRGYPMFTASNMVARIEEHLVDSRKCMSSTNQSDVSQELIAMLPALVHRLQKHPNGYYEARLDMPGGSVEGHYVLRLRRVEE
ncbi:MAG TPA: hypothetical protein VFL53_04205 [Pseudolabrys sp.]|nr:hypothetical protein [Pseudolabrys sp.]